MRIIEATTKEQFGAIEALARRIIPDFYATYFDVAAAEWMVDNGHTAAVLEAQARKGYRHYLLQLKAVVVGYFALHTEGRVMKLSHFYVLEEYRGIKANTPLSSAIFDPKEWATAPHWSR